MYIIQEIIITRIEKGMLRWFENGWVEEGLRSEFMKKLWRSLWQEKIMKMNSQAVYLNMCNYEYERDEGGK